MVNPYGPCYHTKYLGCIPCVHSAWDEGYEMALEGVELAADTVHPSLKSKILDIVRKLERSRIPRIESTIDKISSTYDFET